ncbi:MAG: type I-E CRISPR-associated protein Cse1/CasA [Acidobacteriota bacterium]
MFSFDLTKEGWIPCLKGGKGAELSLADVLLDAHNIGEVNGESPPVTIALHRLLLALLHRIYRGPKSTDEWAALFERGSFDPEKINGYFSEHHDRFDLFSEKHPFYQSASARGSVQQGAVIQLYFQGKNNATLFDHTSTSAPKELSPAEAARHLVAFQGFDFGGTKADGSAKTAPLLQSAIALIRGNSLFETLMFNLHRYNGEDGVPFSFNERDDIPAWERSEETTAQERLPDGPIDLLTWQSRRIALQPETNAEEKTIVKDAVIMLGHSFPKTIAMHTKETMLAFRKNKSGEMFSLGFNENRALWRNSLSLLQTVPGENSRPRTFDWLSELKEDGYVEERTFPIDFYGLAADKAKLLFWKHERFELPLVFLNDNDLLADLRRCLEFSDAMGASLHSGIKALAGKLETGTGTFPAVGEYWSRMESRFHLLLSRIPSAVDAEMTAWFADAYSTAFQAFNETSGSLSGSAAENRAAVAGENEFRKQVNIAIKNKRTEWDKYLPKFKTKGGNE